jgi:hypothetical protein
MAKSTPVAQDVDEPQLVQTTRSQPDRRNAKSSPPLSRQPTAHRPRQSPCPLRPAPRRSRRGAKGAPQRHRPATGVCLPAAQGPAGSRSRAAFHDGFKSRWPRTPPLHFALRGRQPDRRRDTAAGPGSVSPLLIYNGGAPCTRASRPVWKKRRDARCCCCRRRCCCFVARLLLCDRALDEVAASTKKEASPPFTNARLRSSSPLLLRADLASSPAVSIIVSKQPRRLACGSWPISTEQPWGLRLFLLLRRSLHRLRGLVLILTHIQLQLHHHHD